MCNSAFGISLNNFKYPHNYALSIMHYAFFTYVFLSLSRFRLFRRYSSRYGNGRWHGYHTAVGAGGRCGTKNCTMRQPVFLSAHERVCLENARAKRTTQNAGNRLDYFACLGAFRVGNGGCRLSTVAHAQKGVRRVFNRAFVRYFAQIVCA